MTTPKELLKDLYWSFIERYADQESFEAELTAYNTRLLKPAPKLNKIVFSEKRMVIQHLWIPFIGEDFEEDQEDKYFVIETENENGFTLGELMYKINNTGITQGDEYDLSDQDYHFFEGLEYLTDDDPDYPQTKVYYMILGS
jgi:hypothetical protein